MISPDDLICTDTVKVDKRAGTHTIGFVWRRRSTGEIVGKGDGFLYQASMRQARDVAWRALTSKTPSWSAAQFPLAA